MYLSYELCLAPIYIVSSHCHRDDYSVFLVEMIFTASYDRREILIIRLSRFTSSPVSKMPHLSHLLSSISADHPPTRSLTQFNITFIHKITHTHNRYSAVQCPTNLIIPYNYNLYPFSAPSISCPSRTRPVPRPTAPLSSLAWLASLHHQPLLQLGLHAGHHPHLQLGRHVLKKTQRRDLIILGNLHSIINRSHLPPPRMGRLGENAGFLPAPPAPKPAPPPPPPPLRRAEGGGGRSEVGN